VCDGVLRHCQSGTVGPPLEERIGDKRMLHLIQKWLKVGVLEDGKVRASDRGLRRVR